LLRRALTAARACARNLLCIAMDIDVCVATLPCETQSVRVCVQSMKRKKHDVVATRGRGDVHPLTAARACARNLLCID